MERLRIFLSSPGDVGEERALARRVIARVQGAFRGRVILEPVIWEDEPLTAADSFQAQIARPSTCDIVVAVLWSRLGTPLSHTILKADGTPYASGTEYEIEDALAAARRHGRPQILLYQKTSRPPLIGGGETALEAALAQRRALKGFLDRLRYSDEDGALKSAWSEFRSASEFEEILEQHLSKLVARLLPMEATQVPAAVRWPFGSPYRGLESFEAEHAAVFFGRGREISEGLALLRGAAVEGWPFLLLIGASGSGKSSLAKAGLVPLLTSEGVIEGAESWRTAIFRPADAPGRPGLAVALALHQTGLLEVDGPSREDMPETIAKGSLERGAESLAARTAEGLGAIGGVGARLLIVADQLEELFTGAGGGETERREFAALLAALLETGRVLAIATLRSDFYPDFAAEGDLLRLKQRGATLDILAPDAAAIGQMIRLPTAAAGLAFETEAATGRSLGEILLEAAALSGGSLPLLEFTLEELYRTRTGDGVLTFEAYQVLGGLEGSLAQRAEEIFRALTDEARASLGAVFNALVRIDEEEGTLTRARAPLGAFASPGMMTFIETFTAARLFVRELGVGGQPSVAIAHEALLTHWPRVETWAEGNRDLLRMRTRIEAAARRWQAEGRRADYLLPAGRPVGEARLVLAGGLALGAVESELIERSLARAQRQRYLRLGAVAALVLLALAATIGAFIASERALEARRQAETAGRTSAFLIDLFRSIDPALAMGREVTAREIVEAGARKLETDGRIAAEPAVRATLLATIGSAYTGLALYGDADRLLTSALEERTALMGGDNPLTLEAAHELAVARHHAGDLTGAEQFVRKQLESPGGRGSSRAAMRLRKELGLILIDRGEVEEALEHLEAAGAMLEALGAREDFAADAGDIAYGEGTAMTQLGRDDEAMAAYEEALRHRRGLYPPGHSHLLEVEAQRAWLMNEAGRRGEAALLYREVLAGMRAIYGDDHPEVAAHLNNLARVLLMNAEFDEPIALLERAIAIDEQAKGMESADLVFALNSLGQARMGRGDARGARLALERALKIARKEESWMTGPILTNLADLAARQGERARAMAYGAEARLALLRDFPLADYPEEAWRFDLVGGIEAEASGTTHLEAARAALEKLKAAFDAGHLYVRDGEARLERMLAPNPPPTSERAAP